MSKMNILYMVPRLVAGGSERNLCDLVLGINRDEYNPIVLCTGPDGPIGNELRENGIEVIVKPISLTSPHSALKTVNDLKTRNIDICHSYNIGPQNVDPIFSKMIGIPHFISVRHDLRFWTFGSILTPVDMIQNYVSDRIIANCDAVKITCSKIEKMDPSRMKVIYNGIDIKKINDMNLNLSRQRIRHLLGIEDDCIIIGSLANFLPMKDQSTLIRAFSKIFKIDPNLKCLLVGRGPEKERLSILVYKLGLEDQVQIVSLNDNRYEIMSCFDIFIQSSISEGFSNSLLEAMALGKPVIATNVGGTSEAIRADLDGLLIQPSNPLKMAEAILNVISNDDIRRKISTNAKDRVSQQFSMDKYICEHKSIYEELLA